MGRHKTVFSEELARRANADLEILDQRKITYKLLAIVAATKYPVIDVADIFDVAAPTIWRWAKAYEKKGIDGLYVKDRAKRPSKLTSEQKTEILAWVDERRTANGQAIHWTYERLQQAIALEFEVKLGIQTIWAWIRKEDRRLKTLTPRMRKLEGSSKYDRKKDTSEKESAEKET